jgi:hypothetical protein
MRITQIAKKLLHQIPFGDILFRTTGIYFGDLVDSRHAQGSLFGPQKTSINQKLLNEVIYTINKKY